MHELEKKIIELGAIDTEIERIQIDNWFENVIIVFNEKDNKEVICKFKQCFEISLKHDKSYSKGKKSDGNLDYKYFIQDVEIAENEGFYAVKILAWPLEGEILCKEVYVEIQN